jgi:uncharacterized protein DUF748
MLRRRWKWIAGALALLVVVILIFRARLVDEPVRRRMEAGVNAALEGYSARIGRLRLSPLGLGVSLYDVVVTQDAHPDPPVASLPELHASVQWRALVRGKLVADFELDEPKIHVDLRHAQKEINDKESIAERGWQEAAFEIYPLKINELKVDDGSITYIEPGPRGPVRLTHVFVTAENIRNVRSKEGEYPSEVHLSAWLQDTARLQADGHADFLAIPTTTVKADFQMRDLDLRNVAPVAKHAGADIKSGKLSAWGAVEYAPKKTSLDLTDVRVSGADVTYVKSAPEQASLSDAATVGAAKVTQQPAAEVRAERIVIDKSTLGYSDTTTNPPYRVYVADTHAEVSHFTNVKNGNGKPGKAAVRGRFMESGPTRVEATFQPRERRTDFSVMLAIDDTDATRLNDLWRAYGGFDVERGTFAVYSEVGVRGGEIDGYVKTILKDLDVLGPDERKGLREKLYEGLVGGLATVLRNQPRDQVATEVSLSGPLQDPNSNTLEIVLRLVQNAFFKAVLPGFKRD